MRLMRQFPPIVATYVVALACCFSLRASAATAEQQSNTPLPITLEVSRSAGELRLSLSPDPDPKRSLLSRLGALINERGERYPVVILVDDDARISDIHVAEGYVAKAGFTDSRTFIVNKARGFMAEVLFCAGIPTTKAPPPKSVHCDDLDH